MSLPLFFLEQLDEQAEEFSLEEDTSKHVVQVLRMKNGARLRLTNGKGVLLTAEIINDNKKVCQVRKLDSIRNLPDPYQTTIAISLVKNSSRFEWFLEKATEIGIHSVIPLICKRTERQQFRTDRMRGVLVSAMLQSQQTYLPLLSEPRNVSDVMQSDQWSGKYIASCENHEQKKLLQSIPKKPDSIILIGPEGDFTQEEISLAAANGFLPVSLGDNRLRTETAGVVASVMMRY